MVADDIDLADLGHIAFVDGKTDTHAIALKRRNGGDYARTVTAACEILALDLLFGLIEQRLVEGASFGQPDFAQALCQRLFFEFLVADEIDLRHSRPLLDHHDEHAALHFQAHVFEESGCEQRLDRRCGFFIGHGLADFDRKIAEYRARFDALDAFHADIAHHEGVERLCNAGAQTDECRKEVSGHVYVQPEIKRLISL